jgi:hypothetical protein
VVSLLCRLIKELRKALSEEAVARTARTTRLVERKRAIESIPFLWSFLFGMTQPNGSVTKVQEFYKIITDYDAAYSSIQQCITTELKCLLSIEMEETESTLCGRFDRIYDV